VCSGRPDLSDSRKGLAGYVEKTLAGLSSKDELGRPVFKDGALAIGGQNVQIAATPEQSTQMNSRFIEAAAFEVRINSTAHPQLVFGAIGIGESRQDALETAVHEWYGSFGSALFAALADSNGPTLSLGGFSAYPGYMGIRGELPKGTWVNGSGDMHRRILAAISEHAPRTDNALHAVSLMLAMKPGASVEGEARIDARPSAAVLAALRSLDWPATHSYLFKQVYVLKPKTEGVPQ